MPGSLHDVINGLIVAVGHAECLKSEDPELADAVDKFVTSITETRKAFVEKALERQAILRKSRAQSS